MKIINNIFNLLTLYVTYVNVTVSYASDSAEFVAFDTVIS